MARGTEMRPRFSFEYTNILFFACTVRETNDRKPTAEVTETSDDHASFSDFMALASSGSGPSRKPRAVFPHRRSRILQVRQRASAPGDIRALC